MPKSKALPPDQVVSSNDPGDETGHRYRYQWTYSAILACSLLDDTRDFLEVFCEQHEDTLIKHVSGLFTGVQVKTRASTQPAWTTQDEQFIKSCVRFVQLDIKFQDFFIQFLFLTNHIFQQNNKNGKNIVYVLDDISHSRTYYELKKTSKTFVDKIAGIANVPSESAFITLQKTKAEDSLPKLNDIDLKLVASLTHTWAESNECSYAVVQTAAKCLINYCMEASTLVSESDSFSYLSGIEAKEEMAKRRIEGKRITKEKLLDLLNSSMNAPLLLAGDQNCFEGFYAGNDDLLCKKLDAGGFSAVSRNSALNLRDKAEYLGIVWSKKYGEEKGIDKYDHIQTLVLSDAASAFEETKNSDKKFGKEMLDSLRKNFRKRREDHSTLCECSQEHLEGFAYSLTARCKVQWSNETPWKDE